MQIYNIDNLFIVNSVYQLLNAVNLRMHAYASDTADILITDICPNHSAIAERVRRSGLFSNVYAIESKSVARQQYRHTVWNVYRFHIDPTPLLKTTGQIPANKYKRMLTANFDDYIAYLFIILQKANRQIQSIRFEDGGMSYIDDNSCVNSVEKRIQGLFGIRPLGGIKAPLWLYEPSLYSVNDGRRILPMPKLSRDDTEFIGIVNKIFNVKAISPVNARVIFIEASYCADGLSTNDKELIIKCGRLLNGDMTLKLHPRNGVNRFAGSGIDIMDVDMPWELYCLNHDVSDKLLLSVTSNAVIAPQLFLEKPPRTVLLYKLFKGTDRLLEVPTFMEYLDKVLARCQRISAPSSDEELESALKS